MLNYFQIGQRIRKFRKAAGLSQEELAEKIDISTTHMSHIETGNTKLSLPVLTDIALHLDVRTDDLIFESPRAGRVSYTENILHTLDQCDEVQLRIIADMIREMKITLDKNNICNSTFLDKMVQDLR